VGDLAGYPVTGTGASGGPTNESIVAYASRYCTSQEGSLFLKMQKVRNYIMRGIFFKKHADAVRQGRVLLWPTLLACVLALLAACGSQAPDAASLIHDAQKAINADTAFHFKMKLAHPGTPSAQSIVVDAADGDAQKPDKIKGT